MAGSRQDPELSTESRSATQHHEPRLPSRPWTPLRPSPCWHAPSRGYDARPMEPRPRWTPTDPPEPRRITVTSGARLRPETTELQTHPRQRLADSADSGDDVGPGRAWGPGMATTRPGRLWGRHRPSKGTGERPRSLPDTDRDPAGETGSPGPCPPPTRTRPEQGGIRGTSTIIGQPPGRPRTTGTYRPHRRSGPSAPQAPRSA